MRTGLTLSLPRTHQALITAAMPAVQDSADCVTCCKDKISWRLERHSHHASCDHHMATHRRTHWNCHVSQFQATKWPSHKNNEKDMSSCLRPGDIISLMWDKNTIFTLCVVSFCKTNTFATSIYKKCRIKIPRQILQCIMWMLIEDAQTRCWQHNLHTVAYDDPLQTLQKQQLHNVVLAEIFTWYRAVHCTTECNGSERDAPPGIYFVVLYNFIPWSRFIVVSFESASDTVLSERCHLLSERCHLSIREVCATHTWGVPYGERYVYWTHTHTGILNSATVTKEIQEQRVANRHITWWLLFGYLPSFQRAFNIICGRQTEFARTYLWPLVFGLPELGIRKLPVSEQSSNYNDCCY